jgi:CRP-like cAMP-binding protein
MLKPPENHLIARLPSKDRARLLKACVSVPLRLSDVISKGGNSISHVYFPVAGFISQITLMGGKPVLEVGMVGREGMLGAPLALEGTATDPLYSVVQGAGTAWRMTAREFRAELARSKSLRKGVDLYLQVMLAQLTTSAACLRFHPIGPRLARWLLMTQDRAGSDRFLMTQEFLAFMLGVRRAGITNAATGLQRQGLIRYSRGEITVLDRPALIAAACDCYIADRKTYRKLLH